MLIVLDNARDVVFRVDLRANRFDYISPSSADVLGYSPSQLSAMGFAASAGHVHPDDRQAFMEKQGLHDFALVLSTDAMRAVWAAPLQSNAVWHPQSPSRCPQASLR